MVTGASEAKGIRAGNRKSRWTPRSKRRALKRATASQRGDEIFSIRIGTAAAPIQQACRARLSKGALEVPAPSPGECRTGNTVERTVHRDGLEIRGERPKDALPSVVVPEDHARVRDHLRHLDRVIAHVNDVMGAVDQAEIDGVQI